MSGATANDLRQLAPKELENLLSQLDSKQIDVGEVSD